MKICVYGASSESIEQKYKDDAYNLGKEMAARGHSLVFGGGKFGLMGAVMRGVSDSNGESLGVAPTFFKPQNVLCDNCTRFIFTDTMRERKQTMEDNADAFIMTPGGIGTYEEFFEMLTLRQLCRHEKPIGVLNTLGYYNELLNLLEVTLKKGFMRSDVSEFITVSDTPEGLLDLIEKK